MRRKAFAPVHLPSVECFYRKYECLRGVVRVYTVTIYSLLGTNKFAGLPVRLATHLPRGLTTHSPLPLPPLSYPAKPRFLNLQITESRECFSLSIILLLYITLISNVPSASKASISSRPVRSLLLLPPYLPHVPSPSACSPIPYLKSPYITPDPRSDRLKFQTSADYMQKQHYEPHLVCSCST